MFRAPLGLSLHPIARITAPALIWNIPSVRFIAVTTLSVEISMTIVSSLYSMPRS